MKWHELGELYGLPIAFTYPGWKDGDYFVVRTRVDVELWRGHRKVEFNANAPLDAMGALLSLYFYWYEDDKWEPLFGFY